MEKIANSILDIVLSQLKAQMPFADVEMDGTELIIAITEDILNQELQKALKQRSDLPLGSSIRISIENNKLKFKIKVL